MKRGKRRRKKQRGRMVAGAVLAGIVIWVGCEARFYVPKKIVPPNGVEPQVVEMKTTSYCHCRRCCSYSWWLFLPVQRTSNFSWRIKQVGVTASGAKARPGTIAADKSIYPFGTVMYIDGYGWGRVEDTGGAIKGAHIDLYRPNHWWASAWGVQSKRVKVWLPKKEKKTEGDRNE